jgi:Fe-S-cluster containining protein
MNSPVSPDIQSAFNAEREAARTKKAANSAAARAQTVQMYGRLAALQATAIARGNVPVACERGCSFCCHLRVEIRPHEAFVLAHHIESTFSPDARTKAMQRIDDNLRRISPLTSAQHIRAGIACALLEDGACSVYQGRPAACRKYYSVSVETCKSAFKDTSAPIVGPLEDEQVRLAGNAVALGFAKGIEDAGLDSTLYELHFALRQALTNPKAEKRYRDGKKPFVGV